MRILLLIAILLVIFSCKTAKEATVSEADIKKVKVNPEDLVYMLKKGACFGSCPEYKLSIYKNRFVQFMGKRNTDRIGTYGKFLSKEEYQVVKESFEKEKFSSYNDNYPSEIADLPLINIAQQIDGITKTITGKRERPEGVHKVQFRLEQIAENKEGWTYISDKTADKIELKTNKAQIIVNVGLGNQLARWFNKMKDEYGVQILEKLSSGGDSWLITYNTKKHNPDEFLAYLNADPVVKSASFKIEKPN